MIKALEERLQVQVHVPEDCDSVCALGAALLGRQRLAAASLGMAQGLAGEDARAAMPRHSA
jgi:hypothetical protein